MAMFLSESTILLQQPFHPPSITKKISNYIFRFEDKIGQGNFSKVYKGYHQLTNQTVAIKIIELSSVKSPKLQQLLFSEIEVIQSLNHPNILKCYQVLKSQNNCYIVTQLCNGGDLQSLLKKQKCLNEISAFSYISDIFKGLLYLCQRGIVHRDLKIANIFVHNGVCKIADFGFAKKTNNINFFDLDIGSPLYMSPEGMIQHIYGMKTDIWAFGIILYELLHGKTPFAYCTSEYELKRAVVTPISIHSLRPDISVECKQLIMKCLTVESINRPDAMALKNDPFIRYVLNFTELNKNTTYLNAQLNSNPIQQSTSPFIEQQKKGELGSNSPTHMMMGQTMLLIPVQIPPQTHLNNQINYQSPQALIQPKPQYSNDHKQFHSKSPSQNFIGINNLIKEPSSKVQNRKEMILANQTKNNTKQVLINKKQVPLNKNTQYSHSYGNIQNIHMHPLPKINQGQQTERSSQAGQRSLLKKRSNSNNKFNFNNNSKYKNDPNQKNRSKLQIQTDQNFDNVSNSSWSHENSNKKKIPKTLSHQNVNKIQNNLIATNGMSRKVTENSLTSPKAQNFSFPSKNVKTPQKVQHLSSNTKIQMKVNQVFPNKSTQYIPQLNMKDSPNNSPKKFGQIIKGEKKPDANVKAVIKLQKCPQSDQKVLLERFKTKSQMSFAQIKLIDELESPYGKKNFPTQSNRDLIIINQSQSLNKSLPETIFPKLPLFIQSKQRARQEFKRNLICTVMEFKQAVCFLHFCRLYYRFIIAFKKVLMIPQAHKLESMGQLIRNSDENIRFYSRFLLTTLNELIENIKYKEIIYDGENYKIKKVKQDKLKEVTEEYLRKYLQVINRNYPPQGQIIPCNNKPVSISSMKEHNEHLWALLDSLYYHLRKVSQKTQELGQNLLKHVRTLCYFSIRIIEANRIIFNCIHTKSYKLLADTMIENWLTQQFYDEEAYIKLRIEYFKKMNDTNALLNSETNDTETQNNSRVNLS